MFCAIKYLWVNHYPGPNSLEGKNHSGKKQDRLADQRQAWDVTVKLVWTALISQMCFKIPHVFRKTESVLLADTTKKSPLSYKTDSLWNLWTSQRQKLSVKFCIWHMCPSLGHRLPLGEGMITEFKLHFWCGRERNHIPTSAGYTTKATPGGALSHSRLGLTGYSIRPEHAALEHVRSVLIACLSPFLEGVGLPQHRLRCSAMCDDSHLHLTNAATVGSFLGTPEKTRSPEHLLQMPGTHPCNTHVQPQSSDRPPACRATCLVHGCSRSNPHNPTNVTQTR